MSDDRPSTDDPKDGGSHKAETTTRRGALGSLVVLGSAAYAGSLVIPGYAFLAGEAKKGAAAGDRWTRLLPLDKLDDGKPARFKIEGESRDAFTVIKATTLGSVWLQRSGDAVRAMSAECPHLGCAIDLAGDGNSYGCPCHTSKFTLDGKSESGPSPRAMDELETRVVDGWVEVKFERFKQGLTEKRSIG